MLKAMWPELNITGFRKVLSSLCVFKTVYVCLISAKNGNFLEYVNAAIEYRDV